MTSVGPTPWQISVWLEHGENDCGGRAEYPHRSLWIESALHEANRDAWSPQQHAAGWRWGAGIVSRVVLDVLPAMTAIREAHGCRLISANHHYACGYVTCFDLDDPAVSRWDGFAAVLMVSPRDAEHVLDVMRATLARILANDERPIPSRWPKIAKSAPHDVVAAPTYDLTNEKKAKP